MSIPGGTISSSPVPLQRFMNSNNQDCVFIWTCCSLGFGSKAATVHCFWTIHSCHIWKRITHCCFITHCFKWGSYLCVQLLSNLMQMFILTLQENICNVDPLVDFPMTVDNKMSVANVSHSASMTHIHACIILLLILIHSMQHAMLYR